MGLSVVDNSGAERTNAGTSAMVPLYDITLTSDAPSFDIQNIPQNYAHLKVFISARGAVSSSAVAANLTFNGDTGANYDRQYLFGSNATATAAASVAGSSIDIGFFTADTGVASSFSQCVLDIVDYTSTSKHKNVFGMLSRKDAAAAASILVLENAGFWRSTSAINRITLTPGSGNWKAGSRITLYGMAASTITTASTSYGSLVPIYDHTLASTATSFDIQNIPQVFGALKIYLHGRSNKAASTSERVAIRFNNDSGANYDYCNIFSANGSSAGTDANLFGQTFGILGDVSAASSPTGATGAIESIIPNYASTTFHKDIISKNGHKRDTSGSNLFFENFYARWSSTAAVNRITIFPKDGNSFIAGSRLTIYGVAATTAPLANWTPVELNYVQTVSDVTISGSSGSPTTVLTSGTIVTDGTTPLLIEAYSASMAAGSAACIAEIWRDSTNLGRIAQENPGAIGSFLGSVRETPSSGSHIYYLKAWKNGGTDGLISASTGTWAPTYLRITRAA